MLVSSEITFVEVLTPNAAVFREDAANSLDHNPKTHIPNTIIWSCAAKLGWPGRITLRE